MHQWWTLYGHRHGPGSKFQRWGGRPAGRLFVWVGERVGGWAHAGVPTWDPWGPGSGCARLGLRHERLLPLLPAAAPRPCSDMLVAYNALLHFIGEAAQLEEAMGVFHAMQEHGGRGRGGCWASMRSLTASGLA